MRITFTLDLLLPRYWLTWLSFFLWFLLVQVLPFRVQMYLGKKLGVLAGKLSARRRLVVEKNVALCFPELSPTEQNTLVWKIFESTGQGFIDTGIAWFWPKWRMQRIVDIKGTEHLINAFNNKKGVLLFNFHFTSLEIGCASVFQHYPFDTYGVYRADENKAYDFLMLYCRERHSKKLIGLPREDVRKMAKALRKGNMLLYLPDQDYGPKHSVFVPFFGVEAATLKAPTHLAKLGNAQVMAVYCVRKPDNSGYTVEIVENAFKNYGEDEIQDATALNTFLEEKIQQYPDQYLWVHRRFKSRPDQQEDFYQLNHLKSFQRRNKRRTKAWQKKMKEKEQSKN